MVEVRLADGEPAFVVTTAPPEREYDEPAAAPAAEGEPGTARLTLRLPDSLKARVEAAAARDGVSVNTWLVRAAGRSLETPRPRPAGDGPVESRASGSPVTPVARTPSRKGATSCPPGSFPAHDPIDLQVRIPAGDIAVSAAATQTATVTLDGNDRTLAATRVEFEDGTLSIIVPDQSGLCNDGSVDAVVELPEGSSCRVQHRLRRRRGTGELGALDVHSASGDVSAERVSGQVRVDTASGDVSLDSAAEADVETASGDVRIGQVSGGVAVRTASGDVQIEAASGPRADVNAASGDISVGVAPGIGVYLELSSLSGTVSSELEPGEETEGANMTLYCRTISGDVRVSRALPAGDPGRVTRQRHGRVTRPGPQEKEIQSCTRT